MNWHKFIIKMAGMVHKEDVLYEEGRVDIVYAPDIYSAEQLCYRRWEECARQDGWEWVSIFRTIAQRVTCESDIDKFLSHWENK